MTLGSSTPNENVSVHEDPGSPGAPRSRPSTVSCTEPPSATVMTSSSVAENDSVSSSAISWRLVDPVDHDRHLGRTQRQEHDVDRGRGALGRGEDEEIAAAGGAP